ncbi:MAG: YggT family protein [Deltaproteobacteria bacterium]|nr:YggT family protein [Deltaproteobacteria bacterium]
MESLFNLLAVITHYALRIYEWIILIAIVISWVHADPNNPIVSFLNRMTIPVWNAITRWLPPSLQLFSAYASLLLVWFFRVLLPGTLFTLGLFLSGKVGVEGLVTRLLGYGLLALGVVAQNLVLFLILLLLIWFFLTLVNPSLNNPIVRTLYILVDPLITPVQSRLPRMRVDVSPLVVAGVCYAINLFLVSALLEFGFELTQGGLRPLALDIF